MLSGLFLLAVLLQSAHGGALLFRQDSIIHLRLVTPLSSDRSHPGTHFEALVIAPFEQNNRIVIPAGSKVHGVVSKRLSVGRGIRRERSTLQLEFSEYELADGHRIPFGARLTSIDNAREEVNIKGEIRGVIATSSPQIFLQGVWFRLNSNSFYRPFLGLTGLSGRLWRAYSLGPIGAAGLFTAKCLMFHMADPEIRLSAGTELLASVKAIPADAPTFDKPAPAVYSDDLMVRLQHEPFTITKQDGLPAADIMNFAFLGREDQLFLVFQSAGWHPAEYMTKRSFARSYRAFTAMKGYPTAPVSTLLFQGRPPDFVFQKSLNTISKRHHIRIWKFGTADGVTLWLGAATHDTGVAFQRDKFSFTHRISPQIDVERSKVVNDLHFTGCVEPPVFVERPDAVRQSRASKSARHGVDSDGRLAVLAAIPCAPQPYLAATNLPPSASKTTRLFRRGALEARHYITRGSYYYWAYRGIKSLGRKPLPDFVEE